MRSNGVRATGRLVVAGICAAALLAPSVPASAASEPDWTKVESYQPPIKRSYPMMVPDRTGRILLFGGHRPTLPGALGDTWRFDGSRWRELHPEVSPPPGGNAMAAYDAARQEVVRFGGTNGGDDTWIWDGANWTQKTPPLSPPARTAGAMAYDPATRKVVLFGGTGGQLGTLNDTWTWDGESWTLETPQLAPPPRSSFGFADGSATSKPVLFGGQVWGNELGDTWTWDGPNHTWTLESASGPAPRAGQYMAHDPERGKTILIGGYAGNISTPLTPQEQFGDTWSWDGSQWSELSPATTPGARKSGGLAFDAVDRKLRMFGGLIAKTEHDRPGGWGQDTWAWDGATWVREDLTAPGPVWKPMFAREPPLDPEAEDSQATFVAFGGQTEFWDHSSQTWRWDGAEWALLEPEHSPPPRAAGAMVLDEARGQTLLFGGLVDNLGLPGVDCRPIVEAGPVQVPNPRGCPGREVYWASDTWVWDGTDWTKLQEGNRNYMIGSPPESFEPTNTSPPPRDEASIVYDAARGEVVLFGGADMGFAKDDTWVWDGTTWTERHPETSPPERFAAHMTYDPVRQQVVLFGGSMSKNQGWLSDTWVWDGENWTEVLPSSSPSGRGYGVMAFDPSTESSILFGGCANCYLNPTYDETWSWDGQEWSLLQPSRDPGRRLSTSAVSGDELSPMLLFGGGRAGLNPDGSPAYYPEATHMTQDVWSFGS